MTKEEAQANLNAAKEKAAAARAKLDIAQEAAQASTEAFYEAKNECRAMCEAANEISEQYAIACIELEAAHKALADIEGKERVAEAKAALE